MEVRDLIYLLQSRCEPTDEISFVSFIGLKDNAVLELSIFDGLPDDLNAIARDEPAPGMSFAQIEVTEGFIREIVLALYKKEFDYSDILHKDVMEKFKAQHEGKVSSPSSS